MSRRRRHALKSAARARATWDKTLRRRARAARTAAAVTAAAVSVAGAASMSGQHGAAAATSSEAALADCQTTSSSSAPRELARLGDAVFFSANDGTHGRELWKSDGTEAGTVLVKNINPNDTARRRGSSPTEITAIGDTVFFSASDGTRGRELWKSDGTRAGTVLVKNINADWSGDPYYLTAVGGRMFFTADDGRRGRELWKSDGSRAGTVLVKNIAPNRVQSNYDAPHELTARGRRLFFAANDGTRGTELWRSNGTSAGTVLVKDIDPLRGDDNPDRPGSTPSELTAMGGRLFFRANDGTHGAELWKSDGSRIGTAMVDDIRSGQEAASSWPHFLTRMADRLFLVANNGTHGAEMWVTDGSQAGTTLVKDIGPDDGSGDYVYSGEDPRSLTSVGDRVFFVAYDAGSTGLWTTDGSETETALIRDFHLINDIDETSLAALQDQLFFVADDGAHGAELWVSDGTSEGTVMVEDIDSCDEPSYSGIHPSSLTALRDRIFFATDDDTHGEELWVSDGTSDGTVLVKDIRGATP